MKLIIRIILVFLPFISALASSQDTLYVMRWGQVAYKVAVKDLDSISFENALLDRKSITEKIAKDNNYSIFYQGLIATGLVDSLKSDRDKKYSDKAYSSYKYSSSWTVLDVPAYKRYGNTLLMESDSVFRSYSINSLSDLKNYAASVYNQVYPEDAGITDVKNRRNSLNRFIAYHIINKRLSLSNLIDIYDTGHMLKTVDMNEYYETLCPNTLVEVSKIRTINKTNLINRNPDTGNAIQIVSGFNDSITYNGFYYGIDKILSYNPDVDRVLSNKRLRFDMASLFPELTNNGFKTQA
ncbi:MAG: hypothetical protein Q8909_11820, partial [Bacteroidota bacterium]|nr:hypothetical protein [Bacteroidota bacterium]